MFYNKLLITKDNNFNSAFLNFIDNVNLDATLTKDISALERNFEHIPYDFRDADLTMVAGAYKSGQIACYDANGNIVDLGFTRAGSAYGIIEDFVLYPSDVPVLDTYLRSSNCFGYLIEDEISNLGNNNEQLVNVTSSGVKYSLLNPKKYVVTSVGGGVQNMSTQTIINGPDPKKGYVKFFVKPNSENGLVRKLSLEHAGVGTQFIVLQLTLEGTYSQLVTSLDCKVTKIKDFLLVEGLSSQVLGAGVTSSHNRGSIHNTNGNTWTATDSKIGDTFYSLLHNVSLVDSTETTIDNLPRKIIPPTTVVGADIISPITLTQSAQIHIKTAKGAKLLTLPSGTFNIHDYISNDKLICLTIKYI